jgi:hypothetical protein
VQAVEDGSAVSAHRYEPQVAQDAQLLRGGRLRHVGALGELAHAGLAFSERVEQPHTGGGGKGLHELGDGDRFGSADRPVGSEVGVKCCVRQNSTLYPHTYADNRFEARSRRRRRRSVVANRPAMKISGPRYRPSA